MQVRRGGRLSAVRVLVPVLFPVPISVLVCVLACAACAADEGDREGSAG